MATTHTDAGANRDAAGRPTPRRPIAGPHARRDPHLRRGRQHPHGPAPGADRPPRRRHPRRRRQQPRRHREHRRPRWAPSSVASRCCAARARTGSARRTAPASRSASRTATRCSIEMDADLSHDPAALPRLVGALDGGADLAIGSRYVAGAAIPEWSARRRALSRYGNRYAGARARRPDPRPDLGLPRVPGRRPAGRCTPRPPGPPATRSRSSWRTGSRAPGSRVVEVPIEFNDRTVGRLEDVEPDHARGPRPRHVVGPARPAPEAGAGGMTAALGAAPTPARHRRGTDPSRRRAAASGASAAIDAGRRSRSSPSWRSAPCCRLWALGPLEAQLRRVVHRDGRPAADRPPVRVPHRPRLAPAARLPAARAVRPGRGERVLVPAAVGAVLDRRARAARRRGSDRAAGSRCSPPRSSR